MFAILPIIALLSTVSGGTQNNDTQTNETNRKILKYFYNFPPFGSQVYTDKHLPSEFVDELIDIEDSTVDLLVKQEKIDKLILTKLPESYLENLRGGIALSSLPEGMRPKVNGIVRDKQKSWIRKAVELKQLSETEEFRKAIAEKTKGIPGDLTKLSLACVVRNCFGDTLPSASVWQLINLMSPLHSSRKFKEKFDSVAKNSPTILSISRLHNSSAIWPGVMR